MTDDQTKQSDSVSTKPQTVSDQVDQLVDDALQSMKSSQTSDEVEASDKLAESLTSLQSLIERNADELDRLRTEQKQMRESLKNVFENDAQLVEAEQQAQELTRQLKQRKESLDNSPEVRQLKLKLADLKEEMKEIEETLNNHLINLFQLTGSNSFDTSDGDQREFVLRAKVKPKKLKVG